MYDYHFVFYLSVQFMYMKRINKNVENIVLLLYLSKKI